MDQRLEALASTHGGYFSRSDVLDCGYGDRDIRAAVHAREWSRLRAGVYAPAAAYEGLDDAGKHRVLTRAVLDKLGAAVVASHASAVVEHDIAIWGLDLSSVHVTRLDGGSGRKEHGIVHHVGTIVRDRDLTEIDGRLATVPPRAVWELSTLVPRDRALVAMDSALQRRRFVRDELEERSRMHSDWQGARSAGIALRLCDGLAESPGETLTRYACYRFSVPRPTLQHEVFNEVGDLLGRTDFGWLDHAHVGEFDGKIKYAPGIADGADASDVVVREKRREDLIRAEGWGMSRLIWAEVLPPRDRTTAVRLKSDLERSRRLFLRNRTVIALG